MGKTTSAGKSIKGKSPKPPVSWITLSNSAYGVKKGDLVIVTRRFFLNGEDWAEGHYSDNPKKTFRVPDIFIMDAKLERKLDKLIKKSVKKKK